MLCSLLRLSCRKNIIQCVCSVRLMFDMMIDVGLKFYSVPPLTMHVTYRSRSQTNFWLSSVLQIF